MADEYVCDSPEVRDFIGKVKEALEKTASVEERFAFIRPHFTPGPARRNI